MLKYEVSVGIETKHSDDGKREFVSRWAENLTFNEDIAQQCALAFAARVKIDWLCCPCERVKRVSLTELGETPRVLFQADDVEAYVRSLQERQKATIN